MKIFIFLYSPDVGVASYGTVTQGEPRHNCAYVSPNAKTSKGDHESSDEENARTSNTSTKSRKDKDERKTFSNFFTTFMSGIEEIKNKNKRQTNRDEDEKQSESDKSSHAVLDVMSGFAKMLGNINNSDNSSVDDMSLDSGGDDSASRKQKPGAYVTDLELD